MKELKFKEIQELIKSSTKTDELKKAFEELFKNKYEEFSILGFDIYKYSKYKNLEQSLIPFVFKTLYYMTINNCLIQEKMIFKEYSDKKNFNDKLIDIGDGGFQIFNNPLEALVFAFYFQANLKTYNSFKEFKNLREIIGEITLRYALTTDILFRCENNYYGPAIITNSRLLSKDKLNRFLIDNKTINWFDMNLNGIENIQTLVRNDFKKIPFFSGYAINNEDNQSLLFSSGKTNTTIKQVDLLKIDELEVKGDKFSIYSFHSKVTLIAKDDLGFNRYTITLGNLNTAGLD